MACRQLGIDELGVEIMPEAIATRTAMGALTLQHPDGQGVDMASLNGTESVRVSVAEAAALQTFPPGHPFRGKSGKQYLQIGNAVPPLLGYHILKTFMEPK